MASNKTDSTLSKCKNGDQQAFAILCKQYYDYAFRIAFRVIANEENAKDIVQEAFIKVWKNIMRYNPEIKFTTWLYTIVTNLCIDLLRKQKHFSSSTCEEALTKIDLNQENYDNKDLAAIITCITSELSPKQRVIFTLRDLEGLEMEEIAEITKLPATTVKSNLWHARQTIRQILVKVYKVEY